MFISPFISRLIYSDFTFWVGHSPMTPAQVCSISTKVEENASEPYACADDLTLIMSCWLFMLLFGSTFMLVPYCLCMSTDLNFEYWMSDFFILDHPFAFYVFD